MTRETIEIERLVEDEEKKKKNDAPNSYAQNDHLIREEDGESL